MNEDGCTICTMTTADLFRERGWGVGTQLLLAGDPDGPFDVRAVCRSLVVVGCPNGKEHAFECTTDGWSLYRPTPPVPTPEEWRELWGQLEAWREPKDLSDRCLWAQAKSLCLAIDAIKAKVSP